ncbi:beta-galactosidase [Micromonospora yangpuensis]|uniref:Beta-galactosidase n=1 Tax=Micromonospora yangpuensis TaxID=683228 RepID=A0A1C6UJQ4_9ACTN|nr:beta-galactosidase [Micromonospora yangpuensis]GGM30871.1 beta-galactosidase [Micromonospora yangpuensis]SCL54222.1 beta-galactosidase [Micromonospora yangpuensis]
MTGDSPHPDAAPGRRPGLHTLTAGRGMLFGGDYNPEQWPEEVWVEDVALMRAAHVNLVTVGVFSWARIEPEPGMRDFGWLDRVLDLLHDGGIAVDLATPTASPPPWLGHRWPQTLPVDESGHRLYYGARNQWCPSAPVYRERALALVTDLADRYADHPALAMWHVGNEYGQICHCDDTAAAFRDWLRERYGDLVTLNEAWGTTFWSQRYGQWDEILTPRRAPYLRNPTQLLDFQRFCSDALLAHYRAERDILRRRTPSVPVTTNFMGFFKPVDYWAWAPHEDVVSNDWYPFPGDPRSPVRAALTHDLMRGLAGGGPWMLLEQATDGVNWQKHNLPKPAGQFRLESLQAVARGADGLCYFQWRASRFGAERYHAAMVPHAGAQTRLHTRVREHGAELRRLAPLVGQPVPARVALVHDWQSWWACESDGRPSDRLLVTDQLLRFYEPLWRRGVTVDLVPPAAELGGYRLVVVPNLFLLSEATAESLTSYVRDGGVLLVGPFSGVADPLGHIHAGRFPAPLREVLGASGEAWLPVADDPPLRCRWIADAEQRGGAHDPAGAVPADPGPTGAEFTATIWSELMRAESARPVATFLDGDLAGAPAVLRNEFGTGRAWYLATVPQEAAMAALTDRVLADAAVTGMLPDLPDGVEAVRRGDTLFLLNHGAGPARVTLTEPAGDLLTGNQVEGALTLAARDVVVLKPLA